MIFHVNGEEIMIKVRFLKMLKDGRKYVILAILWKWLGLVSHLLTVGAIAITISDIYNKELELYDLALYLVVAAVGVVGSAFFGKLHTDASFEASADVKSQMRKIIYEKLLKLGGAYRQKVSSAQITQMMGEGVEQLEVYFGKYIIQFAYSIIASITLFAILLFCNSRSAFSLLVCVPVFLIVLAVVMRLSGKKMENYLKVYYELGGSFLEKINGMTTLKIYEADETADQELASRADKFRDMALKNLSMQVKCTFILDIITYCCTAVSLVFLVQEFLNNKISIFAAVIFLFLSLEYFAPLRKLGEYFNIGMNGMKSADKIFEFLAIREPIQGKGELAKEPVRITFNNVSFAYDGKKVLENISMLIPSGGMVSIVGTSGAGKSTIAKILRKQNRAYSGSIKINGKELSSISEDALMQLVTTVGDSYIFPGTIKDNLLLGNPKADDKRLRNVLRLVNLWDELKDKGGLTFQLAEGGSNISGGQRQRLSFARALLKNASLYIFDEATSNIDVESEKIIMNLVEKLSREMGRTIILISHRLSNVVHSDKIFMLSNGVIAEEGTHQELMQINMEYANLFNRQKELERFAKGVE